MPRNVTVTFDDGSQHVYENAPDTITPEQVQLRAQQEFGKTVTHLDGGRNPGATTPGRATLADVGNFFKEGARSLVRGAGKGLASLAEGANNLNAVDRPGRDMANGELQDLVTSQIPPPANQSPDQKLIQSVFEGVGEAAATPGPGYLRGLVAGGAGGGAAQLAEPAGPVAQLAAALGAGTAVALPGAGAVKAPALVKSTETAMKAVPETDLATAAARAANAQKVLGTDVLLTQGLPNQTPFAALTDSLLQSPSTSGQMHQLLNAQGPAAERALAAEISRISPVKPGQMEANQVRDAAIREVADRPQDVRSAMTDKLYRQGARETFPLSVRFSAPQDIKDVQQAMRVLQKSDAGRAFLNRYGRVVEDSAILDPAGKPYVKLSGEPLELENFRKELSKLINSASKDSATGADLTKAVGYTKMKSAIDDLLSQNAPALTKARQTSARAFRQEEAVRQGALGQMVPGGADAANKPGNWQQLGAVFRDPASYSPKDVTDVVNKLYRSDPKAPGLLLRQFLEENLESARPTAGGRPVNDSPAQLAESVFGGAGSRKRENVLTAVQALAQQQKGNGAAARAGTEALIDAMTVVGADRSALGKANAQEAQRAAESVISKVLKGAMYKSGQVLSDREMHRMHEAALQALTSPDAVKRLEEVSKYSLANNRLKAAAAALRPVVGEGEELQQENRPNY